MGIVRLPSLYAQRSVSTSTYASGTDSKNISVPTCRPVPSIPSVADTSYNEEVKRPTPWAKPCCPNARISFSEMCLYCRRATQRADGLGQDEVFLPEHSVTATEERGDIYIKLESEENDGHPHQVGQEESGQLEHADMLSQEFPQEIHKCNVSYSSSATACLSTSPIRLPLAPRLLPATGRPSPWHSPHPDG